jgi:hypothetical protein
MKMKTVKYYSTIGLNARIPGFNTRKLVRFACDKLEDGTRKVYVESGRTLNVIRKCGTKIITQEQAEDLFNDDIVAEFRNFAALFNIEV